MTPERERALRDLLGLVVQALDVPHAEHRVDDLDAHDLLRERAARVRAILADLAHGEVLDYTAIQSAGYVLGHQIEDLPVDYDPADPVAAPCSTPALHAAQRCACSGVTWTDTQAAERAQADRAIIGRTVIRSGDDSDAPTYGRIVARLDEEFVEVVWGEARFDGDPEHGAREALDELSPVYAS